MSMLMCLWSSFVLCSLTLCEATARSTKLRNMQSFKSVFCQKKEARLLLTTLPCLTDHEKQSKSGSLKSLPKFVSKRSRQENAYKAPKLQSVVLPALHLKLSRSLTNFQTARQDRLSLSCTHAKNGDAAVTITAKK